MLHLVRHGRPRVDPTAPAATWPLHPDGRHAVLALRDQLPPGATWFSSPEPKALATARLLTDAPVEVVDALAEQVRGVHWFDDPADLEAAVRRAFEAPDVSAAPGWEPLARTRKRVVPAVRAIVEGATGDVVLVGHGTAWTVVVAALTGREPDLDAWAALRMPDVSTLDLST